MSLLVVKAGVVKAEVVLVSVVKAGVVQVSVVKAGVVQVSVVKAGCSRGWCYQKGNSGELHAEVSQR